MQCIEARGKLKQENRGDLGKCVAFNDKASLKVVSILKRFEVSSDKVFQYNKNVNFVVKIFTAFFRRPMIFAQRMHLYGET